MNRISDEIIDLKYWVTILYEILELNQGFVLRKSDGWEVDSESLLQKVACHSLTVLDLLEGTRPKVDTIKSNINFIDYSSIYSIVRSALESYLVFNYVFIDPTVGIRVKKLRHKIWDASSLSQRQKQLSVSDETRELLKEEKKSYFKLRREILRSKTVANVSISQLKNLQKKKAFDWKPNGGWRGIAKKSILSEKYWVNVYGLLSSITHSDAVIFNLFSNGQQKEVQEANALTATSFLNYIIPLFIDGYAKLFPKVKSYLEKNDNLRFNIEVAKKVVSGYGNQE